MCLATEEKQRLQNESFNTEKSTVSKKGKEEASYSKKLKLSMHSINVMLNN